MPAKWSGNRRPAEENEGEQPAKKKKGGAPVKVVLSAPVFAPKQLGADAIKGLYQDSTLEALFVEALADYPILLKIRLLRLMKKAPHAENVLLSTHQTEIDDLLSDLEQAVGEEYGDEGIPHPDVIPRMVTVLAAYMGVPGLEDPTRLFSDGTLLSKTAGLTSISLSQLDQPELCAYTTADAILDAKGDVRCFCGQPMRLQTKQGWQGRGKTQSFVCKGASNGTHCRLNITVEALPRLRDLMQKMGVVRIPKFFCPAHPSNDVVISELTDSVTGESKLKIRCSWYGGAAGAREFCTSEFLGPKGENHLASGECLWKALDLLTRS